MNAEELVQAGRLEEALASLQDSVRAQPADARLRVFLFQLLSVMGQWDRAMTQLQVLGDMDASSMMLAQIFRPVLQCEALRAEVFAGNRTPIVFGEPAEWVGWLVQANQLVAKGEFAAARALREKAFEAAPAVAGKLNDVAFEWIADADPRLGPVLEVIVEGRYCWAPFYRIKVITIPPPADLRDLVWTPAQFTWTNGGTVSGHIPSRYPGTETAADGLLRLARKTEWLPKNDDLFLGVGQRLLTTDQSEIPLFEVRQIEFAGPETAAV